jgi:hypothetical protein
MIQLERQSLDRMTMDFGAKLIASTATKREAQDQVKCLIQKLKRFSTGTDYRILLVKK